MKADLIKDYQELARQSWETFAAQMQKQFGTAGAEDFSRSSSAKNSSANVTIDHALAGLKSYADWLQGAAASVSTPQSDWRQQMQQLFGGASQPFSHGFGGADSSGAKAFIQQWQAWLNASQKTGASGAQPQEQGSTTGFGFGHEQHAQQQALADAITQHLEASQRYQVLMQRSNAQAIEKMQAKLSKLAKPGQQIESLKVLYDLWVDCAEEAYAEIALSEEFREAYGEMVNTQIRVRQLQQEQTEYLCQQLGIPTRSDVSSLGERLQSLRRELRNSKTSAAASHAEEIEALRRDVAALKEQLLVSKAPRSVVRKSHAAKAAAAKTPRSAVKKSVTKASSAKSPKTAAKKTAASTSRAKPAAAAKTRKRK
nr:poly(R)-hydroxyalkanoic acid synthase subunit PhaE [Rhodanobacter sp. MP1X3]